jgi:tetratricopeptide (TPR) repeat protein
LHNTAGARALQEGDLETAGARLEVALEYNPEFVEALTNLGLVEMARGNTVRAEQLFERAVRLNPDIAQPHHALGVLAEQSYSRDVASAHYREALRVDPGFAAARANLARLLLEAGHAEHALVEFGKLRQIAPDTTLANTGTIEALLRLNRTAEARATAVEAARVLGDDPSLRVLEARLDLRAEQIDAAADKLRPLFGRGDAHALDARSWMGVLELARNAPERALTHAQLALELDPDHPLALFVMAVALDDLNDPHAEAWLARATEVNPHNPELERRLNRH